MIATGITIALLGNVPAGLAQQQNANSTPKRSDYQISCAAHEKKQYRVLSCTAKEKLGYQVCSRTVNKQEGEELEGPETCDPCKPKE